MLDDSSHLREQNLEPAELTIGACLVLYLLTDSTGTTVAARQPHPACAGFFFRFRNVPLLVERNLLSHQTRLTSFCVIETNRLWQMSESSCWNAETIVVRSLVANLSIRFAVESDRMR